jgi:formylglycine-generating enzyme required for sulfatase activity
VTSGFVHGELREERDLAAYRISKYPTTWEQFDACVAARQCEPADTSACRAAAYSPYVIGPVAAGGAAVSKPKTAPFDARVAAMPATCVGQRQAEAYCKWVGGRLPTLAEWFLATRGPSPSRYSWGDDAPGCEEHPLASPARTDGGPPAGLDHCPGADANAQGRLDPKVLTVGKHPLGASPAGVEDVLLMPAELLAGEPNALFNACTGAGTHCLVAGLSPGSIDTVEPIYRRSSEPGTTTEDPEFIVAHAYGFRCVADANQRVTP